MPRAGLPSGLVCARAPLISTLGCCGGISSPTSAPFLIPALHEHLAVFVAPGADSLMFPGAKGAPLRRSNFNRSSGWPRAAQAAGVPGVHFHDLRHTGNTSSATGIGIKDLMARMGHDSERAAMIYQHEARGADSAITSAIDAHIQAERERGGRR